VADHSQSAHYAGGLCLEEIEVQHREADRLNQSFGKEFRFLKGIESDILADGSLDYPDEILSRFDFVVAVFIAALSSTGKRRPPASSARSRIHTPRSQVI
jgi:histidinol phosphatase-like PHP family hydrolase